MPGKPLRSGPRQAARLPLTAKASVIVQTCYSGRLLTNAIQVIIGSKAIEVPYRPPTAEEEESA